MKICRLTQFYHADERLCIVTVIVMHIYARIHAHSLHYNDCISSAFPGENFSIYCAEQVHIQNKTKQTNKNQQQNNPPPPNIPPSPPKKRKNLAYRGFPTRMVYLDYISCLRYTILVRNPRIIRHPKQHVSRRPCSNFQLSSKDRLKEKKPTYP